MPPGRPRRYQAPAFEAWLATARPHLGVQMRRTYGRVVAKLTANETKVPRPEEIEVLILSIPTLDRTTARSAWNLYAEWQAACGVAVLPLLDRRRGGRQLSESELEFLATLSAFQRYTDCSFYDIIHLQLMNMRMLCRRGTFLVVAADVTLKEDGATFRVGISGNAAFKRSEQLLITQFATVYSDYDHNTLRNGYAFGDDGRMLDRDYVVDTARRGHFTFRRAGQPRNVTETLSLPDSELWEPPWYRALRHWMTDPLCDDGYVLQWLQSRRGMMFSESDLETEDAQD